MGVSPGFRGHLFHSLYLWHTKPRSVLQVGKGLQRRKAPQHQMSYKPETSFSHLWTEHSSEVQTLNYQGTLKSNIIHESSFVENKNDFGTLPDSGHELMYKRLCFLDDFDLQKKHNSAWYLPPKWSRSSNSRRDSAASFKINSNEQNWTQQVQPVSKIRFETHHFTFHITSHHMFIGFVDMT